MANLEVVNRTLALTPRGNIGDVLTIIDAQTIEFAPSAGGIAGVAIQNTGVPLAGFPFTTINVTGGAIVATNSGGGVVTLIVVPAPSGWTIATLLTTQVGTPAAPAAVADLTAPVLLGQTIHFRFTIFYKTDGTGLGLNLNVTGPAASLVINTALGRETAAVASAIAVPNAYLAFNDGGASSFACMVLEGIALATANGAIGLTSDSGGLASASAAIYKGSTLEYLVV